MPTTNSAESVAGESIVTTGATFDILSDLDGYFPLATTAVAVLLLLLALAVGVHVLLIGREKRIGVRQAGCRLLSWLWALPVVAVVAFLGAETSQYFQGVTQSLDAPAGGEVPQPAIELGESIPLGAAEPPGENDASHPNAAPDVASARPAWIEQSPDTYLVPSTSQESQARLVVVHSAPKLTPELAEADALSQAAAKLKGDFHQTYPNSGSWTIPPDVIRRQAVRKRYEEPVTRELKMGQRTPMSVVHLQMEISPDVRQALFPYWRNQTVRRRLWALCCLVGMLTLMTMVTAAYFRLDALAAGLYRRRLKLAAVSLIVSGGLFLSLIV